MLDYFYGTLSFLKLGKSTPQLLTNYLIKFKFYFLYFPLRKVIEIGDNKVIDDRMFIFLPKVFL